MAGSARSAPHLAQYSRRQSTCSPHRSRKCRQILDRFRRSSALTKASTLSSTTSGSNDTKEPSCSAASCVTWTWSSHSCRARFEAGSVWSSDCSLSSCNKCRAASLSVLPFLALVNEHGMIVDAAGPSAHDVSHNLQIRHPNHLTLQPNPRRTLHPRYGAVLLRYRFPSLLLLLSSSPYQRQMDFTNNYAKRFPTAGNDRTQARA